MIILDSTSKSLEVVLGAAITTNQLAVVIDYVEFVPATDDYTPASFDTQTNSTTAVTILSAPASARIRQVKKLTVYNADTAAASVTIRLNSNSTLRIRRKVTLYPGEHLTYTDGKGWDVSDALGGLGYGPFYGRFLRETKYDSGSGTHTCLPGCRMVEAEVVGGGASGGGASGATSNAAAGGGGGAGAYAWKIFTDLDDSGQLLTYAVGAAGAANTAGANDGYAGTGSTLTCNSTTVTAGGGSAGLGMAFGTTVALVDGGAGGTAGNGDMNVSGQAGYPGVRLDATNNIAGRGGDSFYGRGGMTAGALNNPGDGGVGQGAAGAGGRTSNSATSRAGGAGVAGRIVIREFS